MQKQKQSIRTDDCNFYGSNIHTNKCSYLNSTMFGGENLESAEKYKEKKHLQSHLLKISASISLYFLHLCLCANIYIYLPNLQHIIWEVL